MRIAEPLVFELLNSAFQESIAKTYINDFYISQGQSSESGAYSAQGSRLEAEALAAMLLLNLLESILDLMANYRQVQN